MPDRLYLYGIIPAGRIASMPRLAGIEDGPVAPVRAGSVAALASPVRSDRVRPSRANVHAHHHVVGEIHAAMPVLPVRFGTVLADETSVVEELLEPHAGELDAGLRHVAGKDEYRLKATYLPDVPLQEIVARSAPVRRMRERLAGRTRPPSRDEMIELGEMVAAELNHIRDTDADELMAAVAPHAVEMERLADRSDTVALHAALLVPRNERAGLSRQVERLGDKQRDRLRIELIGPLAPWDFAAQDGS